MRHVERVDARVRLGDGQLFGRRVLVLDDPDERTVSVTHDPSEAGRVRGDRTDEGRPVAAAGVRVDEQAERRRIEQRDVAGEHHDGTVEVGGERLDGDLDRATGTGDVVLVDDDGVGRALGDLRRDEVTLVPDDHRDVFRPEGRRRPQDVGDERQPGEPVQHLGGGRLHARALPGGEDDDGDALVGHGSILAHPRCGVRWNRGAVHNDAHNRTGAGRGTEPPGRTGAGRGTEPPGRPEREPTRAEPTFLPRTAAMENGNGRTGSKELTRYARIHQRRPKRPAQPNPPTRAASGARASRTP